MSASNPTNTQPNPNESAWRRWEIIFAAVVAAATIVATIFAFLSYGSSKDANRIAKAASSEAAKANTIADGARTEAAEANDIAVAAETRVVQENKRVLAERVVLWTKRNRSTGTVEVTVQNYAIQRVTMPQFERGKPGAEPKTVVLLAEIGPCRWANYTVAGDWWNARYKPHVMFLDGRGTWWRMEESRAPIESKKAAVRDQEMDPDTVKLAEKSDNMTRVRDRDAIKPSSSGSLQGCSAS